MSDEEPKPLNYNEMMFVHEFLKDRNRKQASIRMGKPEAWASTFGSRMYSKSHVRAAIDEAMEIVCEKAIVDAAWILSEYKKLYNIDLSEITEVDEAGRIHYDFSDASPELMHAISAIEVSPGQYGTKTKVTIPSKEKLLEIMGKHISVNAFRDAVETNVNVTIVFDEQDKDA